MTAAESMQFLQNPKEQLVQEGLIDEDFRVESTLVNADVVAAADPVCKLLLVFPQERLALLTVYRHPPGK